MGILDDTKTLAVETRMVGQEELRQDIASKEELIETLDQQCEEIGEMYVDELRISQYCEAAS